MSSATSVPSGADDQVGAVLFVSDHRRTAAFYRDMLGFEVVGEMRISSFLRSSAQSSGHDLALFAIAGIVPPARSVRGAVVWHVLDGEVDYVRQNLFAAGVLTAETRTTDGVVLRAVDPDGIEFVVLSGSG